MQRFRPFTTCVLTLAAVSAVLTGCRSYESHPLIHPPGEIDRNHSKPTGESYYRNWDEKAATIEVTPIKSVNPVGSQHILIATVKDPDGNPLRHRRVEWFIPDGGVGVIVEVDESGWLPERGHKITERYAFSHTNEDDHVLTMGTPDPSDDIAIKEGQTWCIVSSPIEGTTHVCAYAPAIFNWTRHKVWAQKHWYDVAWKFPAEATNPVDTPHPLTTHVTKHSDGTPLAGYLVTYKILSGPPAALEPGGGRTATVKTDAGGQATVVLKQTKPLEGTNEIAIDVVRPANIQCCKPAVHIASGKTKKTWIGPRIKISKTAPAKARVGEGFQYKITVSNPSRVDAKQLVVTDVLPDGISYVSSTPSAQVAGQSLSWPLGTLGPGRQSAISVTVKGMRTGKFDNCASVRGAHGLAARDCASTVIWQPALTLEKTGPAEALICDPITYKIVVRNTGDGPAANVRIRDALPDGLVTADGRSTASFDAGTLRPGESKEAVLKVTAKKRGTFINRVSATGDHGLSASASAKTVVREPVLVVTKAGPKTRFIGRPTMFTITVANKGDGEAPNAKLVDTISANAKFVSASHGGRFAAGKVTWDLGDLKVNQSKSVTLTLIPQAKGAIRTTALATAHCTTATAEGMTVIKGIPAILLEVIDIDDPVEVGAKTTYEIVVTNQGSADGTNIVIEATLPPEEQFVSAEGPTKESVVGKSVKFAPLARLAPKAKATFKVHVKGMKTGDVRFAIKLTSDQMSSPVTETESTHIYE